jgi:SRSO17 transposase
MLPSIRDEEYHYKVPKFDLKKKDITNFENELRGYHQLFADCFHRIEPRRHFFNYMAGQFSDLERKSIEPIALAIKSGKVRAMQSFVSDSIWDDDKIGIKHRSLVNEDLGSATGALIFDESGFLKKGKDSIGVARQYCGNAGKVDNCQVGVFAAYTSENGYAMVDKRLFIPEEWFTEPYDERREKCGLPQGIEFRTKPQLAADMLKTIANEKILPFKYVLGDSIYGKSPEFINAAEEIPGLIYFVSVTGEIQCWLKRPMTCSHEYRYKGEMKTKKVLADDQSKPISFKNPAKKINDYF